MPLHVHESGERSQEKLPIRPQFSVLGETGEVPRFQLAKRGINPRIAYEVVSDELLLDSKARLNLATFVTTWMEDEAQRVIADSFAKNLIDKDEYPQTSELEGRCVNILANLWQASAHEKAM